MLDNTRDLTSQDFIPSEKSVEFLQLYAKVEEKWGQKATAFVLLLLALRLNPEAEGLKSELRRLRPESREVVKVMETESLKGTFLPDRRDALVSMGQKNITKAELGKECPICIEEFQEGTVLKLRFAITGFMRHVLLGGWKLAIVDVHTAKWFSRLKGIWNIKGAVLSVMPDVEAF